MGNKWVIIVLFLSIAFTGAGTSIISTNQDGLTIYEELEAGTDPFHPDSDGDGIKDGREVKVLRTGPTAKDTDNDGLTDPRELKIGTDPNVADTDDDGLEDQRELEVGTDPVDKDTDKDTLQDGWEIKGNTPDGTPLPGADPLHRNLYVDIVSLNHERVITSEFAKEIEDEFANMSVRNPDGEDGIDVYIHGPRQSNVTEQELKEESPPTSEINYNSIDEKMYTRERMGERYDPNGIYRLVVVESSEGRGSGGYGGDKIAWVSWGSHKPSAQNTFIHELLHTIVWRPFGEDCHGVFHSCDGYLSLKNDFFFSEKTVSYLQENSYR